MMQSSILLKFEVCFVIFALFLWFDSIIQKEQNVAVLSWHVEDLKCKKTKLEVHVSYFIIIYHYLLLFTLLFESIVVTI